MKRSDSILQQFYMNRLPKAQEGLFSLIDRRPTYDQIPSPGKRLEDIKRMQAAKAAAPATALAKKQREAQIIADRQARIKASIDARSRPFSAQQLADETQAIGDKFRIFPNDPDSFIDEYLNPGVFIGNMASQLGRVPLDVQTGNYGKAAMSVGVPLALGAAEAVVAPLLKKAGNYITTQTPVRNAYKLNPFAYKGSDAFYYRGVGKEGMEDALAQGYFRGKPNVQRVNFPGTNLNAAKSFGNTTYWSPKIATATEYGNGIIAEVPRNAAKFAQKYSKSPWSQFTNQRIGADQAKFLQKDWLRGYREIPTVYTDIRKMTPSNIGKYVDLSTDVSGGSGVHNLGVYPMKRDNRILFKVGFEDKRNPIFEADYMPEDMVGLTRNLDPKFFGKTYKNIGLSPKQAGLFKQAGNRNMERFTGDRQNYDLTGNVISRVEGRNLEQLAAEDIVDIPQIAYQRYIDDIVDLDNKGITYDIFGDNFVYDPAVQRFKLFDLSSKSGVSPIQFNPYGLTPSSSGNKTIMQLDKAKLRENLNQKLRGRFLNDINSDDKMGAYGDDDIVNMFNSIYDKIKNTKKAGGAIVDPRGQWAYPGMNTIVPTPTGQITMQGVPYPVYGQDETGYGQMMMPGGEYEFPGQMVYETPIMKEGGPKKEPKPYFNSERDRELYRNKLREEGLKALKNNDDERYLLSTPYHNIGEGNNCINGVCGLNISAGLKYNEPSDIDRYIGNTKFSDNVRKGKEDYYLANANFNIGDHVQYLTKKGKPTHSKMIYDITTDEQGNKKYHLIHNAGAVEFMENVYTEQELKDMIAGKNMVGYHDRINVYRPGYSLDKKALEEERQTLTSPEARKAITNRAANINFEQENDPNYTYNIRKDSEYYEDQPEGMQEFIKYANDPKKINELVTKLDKVGLPSRANKASIHDSLLNVFGILGQENKWDDRIIGGTGGLENFVERTFKPKNWSIGPGQIKFNEINPEIRKEFGINKPKDLYDWNKLLPLMVAMDSSNRTWMERQGDKFSERIIGQPGLTSDQMDMSNARMSPYFWQGPGISNLRKFLADDYNEEYGSFRTSKSVKDKLREKYISENIRPLQKVFDKGSYGQRVFENIDKNLERTSPTFNNEKTLREIFITPIKKTGGQHGGLDRWFAEKWVDVKTGKACGRQEAESRKGYPACRPSRRVSSETPKTSSEMSAAEKAKFKRSKTSSQRINYNHKRN
jgi:hypothetical protein